MVTTITQNLLTNHNRPRIKCAVRKGIVIHYTGNTGRGATALANRNYFQNTDRDASTQFLVDDVSIIQAIPTWEAAWSVGATSYTSIGKKLFHNGKQPNFTTVSIEMCVNGDSTYDKVVENTVWLTVYLMKSLNLGINDIYRHFDITGKSCPLFYLTDKDWANFLAKVKDAWEDTKRGEAIVLDKAVIKTVKCTQMLNIRKGPAATYDVIKSVPVGSQLNVYEELKGWYRVDGGWVNASKDYSVDIALNIDNDDETVKVSPTVDLTYASGKVNVLTTLNIREQPNTNSKVVGSYGNGTIVPLVQDKGTWYKTDKGWVCSKYIERLDERVMGILVNNANIRRDDASIICTGKAGEDIIVFPGTITVNGTKFQPVKYKDIKGYVQEGSYKVK